MDGNSNRNWNGNRNWNRRPCTPHGGHRQVAVVYFLLCALIWISIADVLYAQDELPRDFRAILNLERSAENVDMPIRSNDVGERQKALREILHEQLERVTNAEQVSLEEHLRGNHDDTLGAFQRENNNEDDDDETQEDEEETEGEQVEYNPWQDSFQDQYEDGSYVYGYSLPNGVTRYERSFYSEKYKGRVVEGFYTQPRHYGKELRYELRCYRADPSRGYKPLGVQYLRRPPTVRRDTQPDVDCFNK